MKGERVVDHSTVIRWFKKFCSVCKYLDDHAKSGMDKTVDSEAVLQAIESNLVSCIQRTLSEFSISQSNVACHLPDPQQKHPQLPNCASYGQNIAKLLTHPCINDEI